MSHFSSFPPLRLLQALLVLLWMGNVCAAEPVLAAPPEPLQKRVLVLVSTGPGRPGVDLYVRTLNEHLVQGGLPRLNMHIEYLDFPNTTDPEVRRRVGDLLLLKCSSVPVDLVIAFNSPALNLLMGAGRELAPGKPVMAVFAPAPEISSDTGRQLTQQTPVFDFRGMMTRALELSPRRVA